MTEQSPLAAALFAPTSQDTESLLAWFDRYDSHVRRNEIDAMADMALFPLMLMTNDSQGECVARQWNRDEFIAAMDLSAGGSDPSAIEIENKRQPMFLNSDLAVVITESTVTTEGQTQHMRYVDVMAKTGGDWRFKSMIQDGWGDMLKQQM